MVDSVEAGLKTALAGVLGGVALGAAFRIIRTIAPEYGTIVTLLELLNLLGSVIFMVKMKYRGSGYLIGYLLGIWLMGYLGIEESWKVALCAIVGVPLILVRFTKKVQRIFR